MEVRHDNTSVSRFTCTKLYQAFASGLTVTNCNFNLKEMTNNYFGLLDKRIVVLIAMVTRCLVVFTSIVKIF